MDNGTLLGDVVGVSVGIGDRSAGRCVEACR
jgi:hypothetical protein